MPTYPLPPSLARRSWAYVRPPSHFDVAACTCGVAESMWSEYKDHLWCPACEQDFVPAHWGVFDGPIPLHSATLLGMDFSRYEIPSLRAVYDHITQAQQQTWAWMMAHQLPVAT